MPKPQRRVRSHFQTADLRTTRHRLDYEFAVVVDRQLLADLTIRRLQNEALPWLGHRDFTIISHCEHWTIQDVLHAKRMGAGVRCPSHHLQHRSTVCSVVDSDLSSRRDLHAAYWSNEVWRRVKLESSGSEFRSVE